jgi:hypothetical protein
MNSNLCEKHFPEPIIYMSDQPLCKKCIPQYLEKTVQKSKEKNADKNEDEGSKQEQQAQIAKLLGIS